MTLLKTDLPPADVPADMLVQPDRLRTAGSPRETQAFLGGLPRVPSRTPKPAPLLSLRPSASHNDLSNARTRFPTPSCAGMRWSVPELGTNLGTNSIRKEFRSGQPVENGGGQGRD